MSDFVTIFGIGNSGNVCLIISREEITSDLLVKIMREAAVEEQLFMEHQEKYPPKRNAVEGDARIDEYYAKISKRDNYELFVLAKELLNVDNLIVTLKEVSNFTCPGVNLEVILEEKKNRKRVRVPRQ